MADASMSFEDFMRAAWLFTRTHWPMEMPEEVRFKMASGKVKKIAMFAVPQLPAEPRSQPAPPPAASEPAASPIVGDIIEALRHAGRRLTVTRLHIALDDAGKRYGRNTLTTWLTRLSEEGTLTPDDPQARPRGYGLPEWDEPASPPPAPPAPRGRT